MGFKFEELAVYNPLFHGQRALDHSSEGAFVSVRGTNEMVAGLNARVLSRDLLGRHVTNLSFKGTACEVAD
ncbi:MAG: hypothetical protein M3Y27_18675 [Acidobacteriota bacterium]|nr:hypothetical protein [Acidobacteriota bacterium]